MSLRREISNLGIGTDIESIDRFRNLDPVSNQLFLDKIFTKQEINYCFSKSKAAPHLAVRYSAKEAITKALNLIGRPSPGYKEIEILNNDEGIPLAQIKNEQFHNLHIYISLSHCEDKALAFAIVVEANNYGKE
jgi:holo-[acyl-carrier protein] synthase